MHSEEAALYARLDALGIAHRTVRHPPVNTVEEAKRHRVEGGGHHIKNLFLRDKKGRMWLLTVLEDRAVDLRSLRGVLAARGGPTFGSPERLRAVLGVEPGAVTPFAVLHDTDAAVEVLLDSALRRDGVVHAHPLHNAATTVVRTADLVRFLVDAGHAPRWLYLDPLIRPARLDDVPALAPLIEASGMTADWLQQVLEGVASHPQDRLFLVAEREGRIVGYARASRFAPDPDDPPNMVPEGFLLVGIQVEPAARRTGVGWALTAARLDWIDARGGPTWTWMDDDNAASVALHRGFGFEAYTRDFVFKAPPRNDAPRTLYRRP